MRRIKPQNQSQELTRALPATTQVVNIVCRLETLEQLYGKLRAARVDGMRVEIIALLPRMHQMRLHEQVRAQVDGMLAAIIV